MDAKCHIIHLAESCTESNLLLNASKTKELIVDIRKKKAKTHPLSTSVELWWRRFPTFGVTIPENLVALFHWSKIPL